MVLPRLRGILPQKDMGLLNACAQRRKSCPLRHMSPDAGGGSCVALGPDAGRVCGDDLIDSTLVEAARPSHVLARDCAAHRERSQAIVASKLRAGDRILELAQLMEDFALDLGCRTRRRVTGLDRLVREHACAAMAHAA